MEDCCGIKFQFDGSWRVVDYLFVLVDFPISRLSDIPMKSGVGIRKLKFIVGSVN